MRITGIAIRSVWAGEAGRFRGYDGAAAVNYTAET
jgi:hypothetical protein